jgi:hypothetical protein
MPIAAGKGVLHGGEAVAHGVGHGIGSVGGFAGRRIGLIKKKDKSGKEVLVPDEGSIATSIDAIEENEERSPTIPALENNSFNLTPVHQDNTNEKGGHSPFVTSEAGNGPSGPGILAVTVLGAKDLKGGQKPYVQVRVGGKTHKTGHVRGVEPEW